MSIKIGNIRTFKQDGSVPIRVDRKTILGNPFHMKNESERDLVCDNYNEYFRLKIAAGDDRRFQKEIYHILTLARTNDVTLLCWCYPKRCHAETIKKYIEQKLEEERENL